MFVPGCGVVFTSWSVFTADGLTVGQIELHYSCAHVLLRCADTIKCCCVNFTHTDTHNNQLESHTVFLLLTFYYSLQH